jgi:hypothetical protein
MSAVLPRDILTVDQPQIGFIDQCGRLQNVAGALGCHVAAGYAVQFSMDQRHELIQGHLVAAVPGYQ